VPTAVESQQDVRAEAKYIRSSARKARIVLEHVRGRTVPEARTVLRFSERAVAREIEKVLHSAVSNAEANHGLIGDELVVVAAFADEGPTIKRWRPRARGRASRINKRTCHITLRLAEAPEPNAPRRKRATAAKASTPASEGGSGTTSKRRTRRKEEATA
jgi:large subunit ribosomal protein L22